MAFEATATIKVLESGESQTLEAFRGGKPLVLDFWHTRCTNCPAALSKLDEIAGSGKHAGVAFAACALSLGAGMDEGEDNEGSADQVVELGVDDQWENLTHVYMGFDEKEKAKAHFGFKAVPFCVVYGADGKVKFQGDPKAIDFATVFSAPAAEEVASTLADCKLADAAPSSAKPLAEANRSLGFGGDDEDF